MTNTTAKKSFISGLSGAQLELLIQFRDAAVEAKRIHALFMDGTLLPGYETRLKQQLVNMSNLVPFIKSQGVDLAYIEYKGGKPVGLMKPPADGHISLDNLVFYRPNTTGHDEIELVLPAPR